ncbi:helix-turn-helix domain-containing protein [Arachnia propionica]|uniref:Helix-turn-helix domain-containing protein n=1 Tax=Arachnia propionica TaxID=1750 RepID=A0A3P1T1B4_9ACTN|nr:helix-turn-helix transcriptional regulator [Arachnia propionica]RRD03190.1 helix-turn-helix domain-containing protein [Arachnia propionica]
MNGVTVEMAAQAVAEAIRAERAAARLSQAEVAERANMSRITYIRYERGERQPTLGQVIQIADALEVPFAEFVHRIEDRIRATRTPDSRNENERPQSLQEIKQQHLQAQAQPMAGAADDRPMMEPDDDWEPR